MPAEGFFNKLPEGKTEGKTDIILADAAAPVADKHVIKALLA